MSVLRPLLEDARVRELLATQGTRYSWGKGTPATLWPPGDCDCSGYAQAALVYLRLLRPTEPDRNAHNLAMISDDVTLGPHKLGDLAFYGDRGSITHVMVALGDDWVIGASGGGRETHGDNPMAHVMLRHILYRRDLVCLGRIRREYHP